MSTPQSSQLSNFRRKSNPKQVALIQRRLDEFIQTSLDKYHFVDVSQDMLDAASIFSKHIVSNKPAIPDLVIYNKRFNKNDCFFERKEDVFIPFPRIRFILKAKPPLEFRFTSSHKSDKSEKSSLKIEKKGSSQSSAQAQTKASGNNQSVSKNLIKMNVNSLFEGDNEHKDLSEQYKDKYRSEQSDEFDFEKEIDILRNELSDPDPSDPEGNLAGEDVGNEKFTSACFGGDYKFNNDEQSQTQGGSTLFADFSLFTNHNENASKTNPPQQEKNSSIIKPDELHFQFNNLHLDDIEEETSQIFRVPDQSTSSGIISSSIFGENINQKNLNDQSRNIVTSNNYSQVSNDSEVLNALFSRNILQRSWQLISQNESHHDNRLFTTNEMLTAVFDARNLISGLFEPFMVKCVDTNYVFKPSFVIETFQNGEPKGENNSRLEPMNRMIINNCKTNKFNHNANQSSRQPMHYQNPFGIQPFISPNNCSNPLTLSHAFSYDTQGNMGINNTNGFNNNNKFMCNNKFNNIPITPQQRSMIPPNLFNLNPIQNRNINSVSPINQGNILQGSQQRFAPVPKMNTFSQVPQSTGFNEMSNKNKFNNLKPVNNSLNINTNMINAEESMYPNPPRSTNNFYVNPLFQRTPPGNCLRNPMSGMMNFNLNLNLVNSEVNFNNFVLPPFQQQECYQRELEKPAPFRHSVKNKFSQGGERF